MKLYLVLGGLLILTLILASISQRYHAYVEERRRQIERILRRVDELDDLSGQLQGLPLPAGVLPLLRRDALARLEVIRQVHPRQPGIVGLIDSAKSALAEAQILTAVQQELDDSMLERLMKGLAQVRWMLREQRFVTPLQDSEREQLLQAIALRQAEVLYRFHRRQAEKRSALGELHQALWHCNQVRQFLREQGPDNDQIRAWQQEMDQLYQALSDHIRGQSSEPPPGSSST